MLQKTDTDINFTDATRIGSGINRSMLPFPSLPHKSKKSSIYTKVENLKEARNEGGRKFYINDHLPESLNEKRRCTQQMKWINSKKDIAHKDQISVKRGKVFVNDQPYSSKVHVPTAGDFTSHSKQDRDRMSDFFFARGETKYEKGPCHQRNR